MRYLIIDVRLHRQTRDLKKHKHKLASHFTPLLTRGEILWEISSAVTKNRRRSFSTMWAGEGEGRSAGGGGGRELARPLHHIQIFCLKFVE